MAGKEQVTLEVDHLIAALPKVSAPTRPWREVCIHKLQEKIHAVSNPSAFAPTVVSIGPIHHGEEKLKLTEECKLYYMSDVLTRNGKNDVNAAKSLLQECVESIQKMEKEIRACYADPIHLESKELVELMVVDGLFIVGLFQNFEGEAVTDDDPLAHNPWGSQNLAWDLLLLENQIPMFVLKCLYKLTASEEEQKAITLERLSHNFFKRFAHLQQDKTVLSKIRQADMDGGNNYKHLLDQLAHSYQPLAENRDGEDPPPLPPLKRALRVTQKFIIKLFLPKPNTAHTSPLYISSATQLHQAGIKFVKGSTECSFLDISCKDGVLTMPPVGINPRSEPLLRNLIMNEQFSDQYPEYVTSYALLMDRLIVTEKDVEFLSNQGILTNNLGRHEDVAGVYSRLKKEIVLGAPFYYRGTFKAVNKYYNNRWNYWYAAIKRKYFSNPWVTIAVFFGSILLFLTTLKTIIETINFYVDRKSKLSGEFNPNFLKLGYY
ncbi:hypothetical protein MKW94_019089 [Papaver nudicaule]|uniref:Uncharacterized protein n=1 Tax=Papaver nudicaule TaxID=74823 RepID=A0AA41SMB8_PAPNU|nr:hypothetical protein [Papaver nudicaule]